MSWCCCCSRVFLASMSPVLAGRRLEGGQDGVLPRRGGGGKTTTEGDTATEGEMRRRGRRKIVTEAGREGAT